MSLFIIFVFGAVVLGAGAMFSPALPTRQPRIGIAASLALALVIGGAIFWQELFGADTLVIDYVLFALVSFVVLGGTLSQAQMRAEAKGEELLDADQGWTGPQDLVFFTLAAVLILLVLRSVVPVASDGVFSPGYDLLTDYLSQQLTQSRTAIQQSMAAVMAFLGIWGIYDLGSELQQKRTGRTMALAWIPAGVFVLFSGGMFTALMGLAFVTSYLLFMMRVVRHATWQDSLGAGLMLGASLYVSIPALLVALILTLPWLIIVGLNPLPKDDTKGNPPSQQRRRISLVAVPLVMVVATFPWLITQFNNPARDIYWRGLESGLWIMGTLAVAVAGGFVLLRLWDSLIPVSLRTMLRQRYYLLAAACAVVFAVIFALPV
jgi:hypothetical protein